ncbi:MAG: hypothetical protein CMM86_03430 [Rhodovulum sp.]|nr:hypothetical protein [Rhodovulum sp.]|tara:strand:- start:4347 stop:4949 length:603 start_codon:yes stop_codon:yes gene_type:complete
MFEIFSILLVSLIIIQILSLVSKPDPIAPHLSVYNEQEASSSSIMHRITGFFLAVPFLSIFLWERSFTIYLQELIGDFMRELRKLDPENQVLIKTDHPSIKPYLDKIDFTYFQPLVPQLEDPIIVFICYAMYIVAVATVVAFFIAVLYHALHGIQHWFWDDFVTAASFSIARGPIASGMYEHAVWVLWCAPFYLSYAQHV